MENSISMDSFSKDFTDAYILCENEELKQQLAEVRQLLSCNKRALRVGNQSSQQQRLLTALYQQNQCLKQLLSRRHASLQTSLSNALINDQLLKNSQAHQKSVIDELNIKLVDLRRQLRDRDRKIEDIQKTHQIIDSENVLQVKLLEMAKPSGSVVKQHDNVNKLREQLAIREAELVREKVDKADIFRMNVLLNKQMGDLRAGLSCHPTAALTSNEAGKHANDNSERLAYIFEIHRTLFNTNNGNTMRTPNDSLQLIDQCLPAPLARQQPKKKPSCIPVLQLTKAKQIQQIIVKSMFEQQKNTKHQITFKQLNALKEELASLKKNINVQVLKNIELSRKTDNLQRLNSELEYRNRLLEMSKGIVNVQPERTSQEETTHNESRIEEAINIGRAVYLNANIEKVITSPKAPGPFIRKQRSISQK